MTKKSSSSTPMIAAIFDRERKNLFWGDCDVQRVAAEAAAYKKENAERYELVRFIGSDCVAIAAAQGHKLLTRTDSTNAHVPMERRMVQPMIEVMLHYGVIEPAVGGGGYVLTDAGETLAYELHKEK